MTNPLTERLRVNALYDSYGSLLTDKQRECLVLYIEEDLSLSEIGDALSISRQGVHHQINRAIDAMEHWETHLSLVAQEAARAGVLAAFDRYEADFPPRNEAEREARTALLQLMHTERGDHDGI